MSLKKVKAVVMKNTRKRMMIFGGSPRATPRHMSHLLRLLPSRPGRVHKLSLRGDPKVTRGFIENLTNSSRTSALSTMRLLQSSDNSQFHLNLKLTDYFAIKLMIITTIRGMIHHQK